jgi:hypothetical protein
VTAALISAESMRGGAEVTMAQRFGRGAAVAVAAALVVAGVSTPALGVLPVLAALGKQIVQNMLIDGVKSQLIGSLAQSGCKGAALASMLAGSPGRSLGGMLGGGALGGGTVPGGMPQLPTGPTTSSMGDPVSMRAARGGVGILEAPPGTDPRSMDMS